MLVTTYQRETKLQTSEINVNFNNTMLENVNFEKFLGVIIDKHLSLKHHIDKTSKIIALLKGIRKYLPHQNRLMFYKTFIQPHIDYCSTIWGQSPHIYRIHILQNISLRLIMTLPKLTYSAPLFKECQFIPIQDRVKFRTVTMVYKTLYSLTPTYMKELFTYQSEMSIRNTRYCIYYAECIIMYRFLKCLVFLNAAPYTYLCNYLHQYPPRRPCVR